MPPTSTVTAPIEPLTEREAQVLALIARGKTNGEIASELDITFNTAKTHVASVLAKLGVERREEAAAWWQAHGPVEPVRRRRRWRHWLAAPLAFKVAGAALTAAAVGGLAVLGVALLANQDRGETPGDAVATETATGTASAEATPSTATPTAQPSVTATPPPTQTIQAGPPLIDGLPFFVVEGAFARETLPPGSPATGAGAYFVDTNTGVIERVFTRGVNLGHTGVSPDNQFVFANGFLGVEPEDGSGALIDRTRERVIAWPRDDAALLAASEHGFLFAMGRFNDPVRELLLVDRAFADARSADIDLGGALNALWMDEDRVVVLQSPNAELGLGPAAVVLDMRDGSATSLAEPWPSRDGAVLARISAAEGSGGGGRIALDVYYSPPDTFDSAGSDVRVIDGTGAALSTITLPADQRWSLSFVSPDGTLVAIETSMRYLQGGAPGGGEMWPTVLIADVATGEILYRVREARFLSGDGFLGSRWLPDSSGFIVEGAPVAEDDPRRFYLISRDGSSIELLDLAPEGPQAGVIPAPDDGSLVALNPSEFGAIDGGSEVQVTLPDDYAGHLSPWGWTSDELRFLLFHGGHGGGTATRVLPPRIEYPPFDNRIRLAVAGGGACVERYTEPVTMYSTGMGLEGELIDCLDGGTVVEVVDHDPTENLPRVEAILFGGEGEWWLHVQTPDGQAGWIEHTGDRLVPPPQ